MKRNMVQWLEEMKAAPTKKAMPVLSFPAIQLLDITVKELISSSDMQARGMKMVAERVDSAASVSLMDLSVEAECFGSQIQVSDDEVPNVIGAIVSDEDEAAALEVPKVGTARTGIYIDAIRKACEQITDRPVFAGVIGPFSLAGRLMDVSEAMILCYEDPDMVHVLLEKCTEFLIQYITAYKEQTGANGVVMAEPLAGLLSPKLNAEFSEPYCKRINEAVQDEHFIVIYHNCGPSVIQMADSIFSNGAAAYHFGNAIDMEDMMKIAPSDKIIMGNVDPAGEIRNGTTESVRAATLDIMNRCCKYPNFAISSGCDIPPLSKWENIDAFFAAVAEFYNK